MTQQHKHDIGVLGESLAAQTYQRSGGIVIARNYRCKAGEIDLVVDTPDGVRRFVEVKTRRSAQFGAAEAVGARKLAHLRAAIVDFVRNNPSAKPVQIDVVAIIWPLVGAPEVQIFSGVDCAAC